MIKTNIIVLIYIHKNHFILHVKNDINSDNSKEKKVSSSVDSVNYTMNGLLISYFHVNQKIHEFFYYKSMND